MNRNYLSKVFLNCRKTQMLYCLSNNGIPIDYLFYNSYISVKDVFKHTIVEKKNRLTYDSPVLDNLQIMGITVKSFDYDKLESHEQFIIESIEEKRELLLWANNKYLFHVTPTAGQHSIILLPHKKLDDSFTISDPPYMPKANYKSTDLYLACNSTDNKSLEYIDYDNFNINIDIIKDINALFDSYVKEIEVDITTIYSKITSFLNDKHMHEHIEEAFAIISGSRYFFALFLYSNNYTNEVYNLFIKISKQAEFIKNQIIKQRVTNKFDLNKLADSIEQISTLEEKGISLLKQELKQSVRINNMGNKKPFDPININIQELSRTESQIEISWKSLKDQFVTSYVILLNDQLYKRTLDNSILLHLEPGISYEVVVMVEVAGETVPLINNHINIKASNKVNLASHNPVVASSEENSGFIANNAVDELDTTRWSSGLNNIEWIYVDLVNISIIESVHIYWEDAFAKSYKIQVSLNTEDWIDIYTENDGKGGHEEITGLSAKARYLRVLCLEKATEWGYSLWHLKVFGE